MLQYIIGAVQKISTNGQTLTWFLQEVFMKAYTNIIPAKDLATCLPNCVLLDCRAKLGDVAWGKAAYLAGHIPGAVHADLDKDLAAPPGRQGRHPLPDRQVWATTVAKWGIGPDSQVVMYDDAGGPYAARAWWMLRWLGHPAVAVLDGGLQQWQGPLNTAEESTAAAPDYPTREPLTKMIATEQLLELVDAGTTPTLIDARAEARWAGLEEPIDPVAGHIPGALCQPFQNNLDATNCFKSSAELQQLFKATGAGSEETISYCGSGVTATHNILAMHIAGLPEATLFAESWSGWITDSNRPIAREL